jgi:hypothetical protein
VENLSTPYSGNEWEAIPKLDGSRISLHIQNKDVCSKRCVLVFTFIMIGVYLLSSFPKSVKERCTVVGTKPCVPRPLEVRDKGLRGVADKEASVRTANIISQRQYFVMFFVYVVYEFVFHLPSS